MQLERSFGSEASDASGMRTHEFIDASMNDEEVVDEAFEVAAVDAALRAQRLPSIGLQMMQKMKAIFVRVALEGQAADATARRQRTGLLLLLLLLLTGSLNEFQHFVFRPADPLVFDWCVIAGILKRVLMIQSSAETSIVAVDTPVSMGMTQTSVCCIGATAREVSIILVLRCGISFIFNVV